MIRFRTLCLLVFAAILVGPAPTGVLAQQRKKSVAKTASTTTKRQRKTAAKRETAADARRLEAETQQDIARTRQQIRENEVQVKRGLSELGKLRTDIDAGEKLVARASQQVQSLSSQIESLESQISQSEADLLKMRTDYLRALKKIRARRNSTSDLAFIFSASDFSQAMQRMRYLRRFAKWRDQRAGEITGKVAALNTQRSQLAGSRVEKDRVLAKQMTAQNTLRRQYAEQDQMVGTLKKNGDALRTHLRQKQAEANSLKGRIAALIAEEQRKAEAAQRAADEAARKQELAAAQKREAAARREAAANAKKEAAAAAKGKENNEQLRAENSTKSAATSSNNAAKQTTSAKPEESVATKEEPVENPKPSRNVAAAASSGFGSMRGALPRPVSGAFKVTSRFGRNTLPGFADVAYDNPGIDAQVAQGSTARAVYPGKVSGVYVLSGYSTVVIVNHGGYYTVYGNLAAPSVRVGDSVKQGDAIGRVANDDDNPSMASIHFEVWRNRDKLNPLDWIR